MPWIRRQSRLSLLFFSRFFELDDLLAPRQGGTVSSVDELSCWTACLSRNGFQLCSIWWVLERDVYSPLRLVRAAVDRTLRCRMCCVFA